MGCALAELSRDDPVRQHGSGGFKTSKDETIMHLLRCLHLSMGLGFRPHTFQE